MVDLVAASTTAADLERAANAAVDNDPGVQQIERQIEDLTRHISSLITPQSGASVADMFFDPSRRYTVVNFPNPSDLEERLRLLRNGWIVMMAEDADAMNIEALREALDGGTHLFLGVSQEGATIPFIDKKIDLNYVIPAPYLLRIIEISEVNQTVDEIDSFIEAQKQRISADEGNSSSQDSDRVIRVQEKSDLSNMISERQDIIRNNPIWIKVATLPMPKASEQQTANEWAQFEDGISPTMAAVLALQGKPARFHFMPQDAGLMLRAAPGMVGQTTNAILSRYNQIDEFLTSNGSNDLSQIACCIIQALGANAKYDIGDKSAFESVDSFLLKITILIDIIILLVGAPAAPSLDDLWDLLLNLSKIITELAIQAGVSTLVALVQYFMLRALNQLSAYYRDLVKKGNANKIVGTTIRCFALENMLRKLIDRIIKETRETLTDLTRRLPQRDPIVDTDLFSFLIPEGQQADINFLQGILYVLRSIRSAVRSGELCANAGYTDIPNSEGNNLEGDTSNDPADSIIIPTTSYYPGQDGDQNQDQGQTQQGESGSDTDDIFANFLRLSGNDANADESGGSGLRVIYGPTDDELTNFFVTYFDMSASDAQDAVNTNRKGTCKEKLSSTEAGIIGAILKEVDLEL